MAGGPPPFAAEAGASMSLAALMERTRQLDDGLMGCCRERDALEAELGKMSKGAGRTMAERRRKGEVEARLAQLAKEISALRLELKRLR